MSHVSHARTVHVAALAQDGFLRLVHELVVTVGITESQAIEILLSYAQLKAGEHGVTVESLPGEEKRMLFN